MGKDFTFPMSKHIMELSQKPLRSKIEANILLLNTVRMLDIQESLSLPTARKERIIISIGKMSRIFYLLEKKWFSMHFPFIVRQYENSKDMFFHNCDIRVSQVLLSRLLTIFESMQNKMLNIYSMLEMLTDPDFIQVDCSIEEMWLIVSYLLQYELGYLRYDIDLEHEPNKIHPLYHLDICLSGGASYKLGLEKELNFKDFRSILDVTTKCWYLKELSS